MEIYDKLMNLLTSVIFPNANGVNILELEWDHLIVLDACRCDIFKKVYRYFFPESAGFKCIQSTASSTMEFTRKNILESPKALRKLKNVVFINANPVIDHILGDRIHEIFCKYIPVWRRYWNENLGTVKPEHTYKAALKAFLKHPNKKLIVWFLQPHYPYVNERFRHINSLGKEFMNKATRGNQTRNLITLIKIATVLTRKGYLCAGMPDRVCEYIRNARLETIKAYIYNLITVLYYAKKLTKILLGKIIITSDHGEAFGEYLSKLIPLHVYGHPSRIHIASLNLVPYLEIRNDVSKHAFIRLALRELAQLSKMGMPRKHQDNSNT